MSNQTLPALHELLALRKPSAGATGLPLDPDDAAAAILNRLATGDFLASGPALAALRESNLALMATSPEGIRNALGRQATVLQALFHHLAARGMAASQTESQSRLIHAAVGCQQACMRTLVALGASAPCPADG